MSRALVFSAVAIMGLTTLSEAEPGPLVQQLLSTPVSEFTFGLYQLNDILEGTFSASSPSFSFDGSLSGPMVYLTGATYDWDKNTITIALISITPPPDGWDKEEECKQAVAAARVSGGVNLSTGKPFGAHSSFANLFFPIGYDDKRLDASTVGAQLDAMFVVDFTSAGDRAHSLHCTAPLLGTGYSVVKQ